MVLEIQILNIWFFLLTLESHTIIRRELSGNDKIQMIYKMSSGVLANQYHIQVRIGGKKNSCAVEHHPLDGKTDWTCIVWFLADSGHSLTVERTEEGGCITFAYTFQHNSLWAKECAPMIRCCSCHSPQKIALSDHRLREAWSHLHPYDGRLP
jgi:hypothetical protein